MVTVGEYGINEYGTYNNRYFTKTEQRENLAKARVLVLKNRGIINPQTGILEYDE